MQLKNSTLEKEVLYCRLLSDRGIKKHFIIVYEGRIFQKYFLYFLDRVL